MKTYNRLLLTATFACLCGASFAEAAFPSRPVTLIVPYPPGGSADIHAQASGQKLGTIWDQTVIIENRASAGTAIGAKAVATAQADGYTLLMGTVSSHAINPAMNKVGYDPVKDFTAVAPVASIAFVLLTHPTPAASKVQDVVALAKAKPGDVSYAFAGPGTSNHLAGVLFESASNIGLLHVPYKGSAPALNDVMAGHVKLMFGLQATALPHIASGKLKALAVTRKVRSPQLPNVPNVPTMVESAVPGYEVNAWFDIFAPAGIASAVTDKLNQSLIAVLKMPDMQKQLRDLGVEPEFASPDIFSAYVRSESPRWAQVVKGVNLTP